MRLSRNVIATAIAITLPIAGIYLFLRSDNEPSVRATPAVHLPARAAPLPAEETHQAAPSSARTILVENGMLSLALHDQPLGPVLVEISKKSRVNIFSLPAIDTHSVTIDMWNVPLDRGLQELLRNYDVFFYNSGGLLRSAWVYEREAGAQLVPVPPASWASTADVERQMRNGSPAERISAIETLVARDGPDAGNVVSRALLDENEDVRLRGLDVALSAGVSVSRETLTSLTYDSSAPVRVLAMQAIASGTPLGDARDAETEQLLRRMMGDADSEVRAKASEILDSRHPGN